MTNEKESYCYSGGAVRVVHASDNRGENQKGDKMKMRFLAAVLAAFFMLPALSVAAAHGEDEYCPADDAPVLTAYAEPQQEELPQEPPPQDQQGLIDITPRTEAPSASVTVTDNIEPENTEQPTPAEEIPAQELPAREPDGTSNPFTPSGTGEVVDNATESDGKEFFTIMTPDENTFYLVIDRQRGTENVYLLNAVTEADLSSLAKMPEQTAPVVTEQPTVPAEPEPEPPAPEKSGGAGMMVIVVLVVLVGGGVGWYFKIYRPKQQGADSAGEFDGDDYGDDESDPYGCDQDADYDGADWDAAYDEPEADRLPGESAGEDA